MRKILLFFIPLFLFMFAFSSPAQAQTLTINPTSGDSNTTFRLSGTGYTARQSYSACAYPLSGGDFVVLSGLTEIPTTSLNITFGGAAIALWGGGDWEARVFETDCGRSPPVSSVTFNVSTAVITPPREGDTCDPNLQSDLRFRCPDDAPCTLIGGSTGGPYICRASSSGSGPGFQPQPCTGGIQTGIGCIPTEAAPFASFFLGYILGIAGIVAFFLIVLAGFQILTSAGNPEKLEGAKQLLTAAVVGALFIIFSVVLLQVIGVNILELRGLRGFPIFQ